MVTFCESCGEIIKQEHRLCDDCAAASIGSYYASGRSDMKETRSRRIQGLTNAVAVIAEKLDKKTQEILRKELAKAEKRWDKMKKFVKNINIDGEYDFIINALEEIENE